MLQKISKKFNFVSSSVNTYKLKKNKKGFTLIELIIVIAIIGILVAAAMMHMGNSAENSRIARAKEDVRTLAGAAVLYSSDNPTATEISCDDLLKAPKPYLTTCPNDPWGGEYKITYDVNTHLFQATTTAKDGTIIDSNQLAPKPQKP